MRATSVRPSEQLQVLVCTGCGKKATRCSCGNQGGHDEAQTQAGKSGRKRGDWVVVPVFTADQVADALDEVVAEDPGAVERLASRLHAHLVAQAQPKDRAAPRRRAEPRESSGAKLA